MFNHLTNTSTGAAAARRAHLLVYDIPTASKMLNPSEFLWGLGARINKSCWVVPDFNVALIPVKAWQEKGAVVELVRFDERDGDTILRLAREALLKECDAYRAALEEANERLRVECAKVTTVGDDSRKRATNLGNLASFHLRRARKFAANARKCAVAFDLLGDAEQAFAGLREAIAAKEELFYAHVQGAKKRSTPDVPEPTAEV